MKRILSALLLLALAASALWKDGANGWQWVGSAVAAERVRTEDGRIILLKEDGTYEIVSKIAPQDSYRSVSFDDLILLGSTLSRKRVSFSEFIYNNGNSINEKTMGYKDRSMHKGNILVDLKNLPTSEKRSFLERCEGLCQMKIEGVMGDKLVTAEHLVL